MAMPLDQAVVARSVKAFEATRTKRCPQGNECLAARTLGISRSTLQYHRAAAAEGRGVKVPSKADLLDELVGLVKARGPQISAREYESHAAHPGMFAKFWKNWAAFRAAAIESAGLSEALVERERQRFRDQIARLSAELKQARRDLNLTDDLRAGVFKLASQPIDPPAWSVKPKASSSGPGVPLLFCSDFQWGEVISSRELDGINEFNRDIASRRYKRLIERTIDLSTQHMVRPKYPGIVVVRGGDMISGDIHDELRKTNDLQSIPAAIDLIEHECAGLRQLAEVFGQVWVVSIPGNHGRVTVKPESKRYVETNYDYLIACMIEREFRADKRLSFHTPLSGDALFSVMGYRFLATHGDRVGSRGGQGFIGPAATIARGMKKVADGYAALGQTFDYQLFGHFHTALELELGWSNGSLPGYSEYARDFRATPKPPIQWLLFVHPKWGVTCRWPILLEHRPKLAPDTMTAFGALK